MSAPRRRSVVLLMIFAFLSVLVPFLFWMQTWFGRQLTSQEIGRYLGDNQHPRKIQHALSQMSVHISRGDRSVQRWYPQVAGLTANPSMEVRTTAAWVMGQDNRSELFHAALRSLLADPELLVRRNAALALVRFADLSGRGELLQMLQPYVVRSPRDGTITAVGPAIGHKVSPSTLLAKIKGDGGGETVVRSPLFGQVDRILAHDGARVASGVRILSVSPEPGEVWEALRALYLIGQPEDLAMVEPYARGLPEMPARIRQQATLTAQAIRTRSERNPIR